MNDIDLSKEYGNGWTPIGIGTYATFDGNGKTVSGLYINNDAADNIGLFSTVNGTVKDLNVSGTVTGKTVSAA